jgi:DNA-binding HxlR family transcriptional regulator
MPLSEWLAEMPVTEFGACPVRDVLDRIGDKWSMLVITLLGDGPMRFMELKRSIGLVSQRMLTRTLRALETRRIDQPHRASGGAAAGGLRAD